MKVLKLLVNDQLNAVRIAAIESIGLFKKTTEETKDAVGIATRQIFYRLEYDTYEGAVEQFDKLVELLEQE